MWCEKWSLHIKMQIMPFILKNDYKIINFILYEVFHWWTLLSKLCQPWTSLNQLLVFSAKSIHADSSRCFQVHFASFNQYVHSKVHHLSLNRLFIMSLGCRMNVYCTSAISSAWNEWPVSNKTIMNSAKCFFPPLLEIACAVDRSASYGDALAEVK